MLVPGHRTIESAQIAHASPHPSHRQLAMEAVTAVATEGLTLLWPDLDRLADSASDPDLAFRHLLIQQALYESMPAALRTALHAEAARELPVS